MGPPPKWWTCTLRLCTQVGDPQVPCTQRDPPCTLAAPLPLTPPCTLAGPHPTLCFCLRKPQQIMMWFSWHRCLSGRRAATLVTPGSGTLTPVNCWSTTRFLGDRFCHFLRPKSFPALSKSDKLRKTATSNSSFTTNCYVIIMGIVSCVSSYENVLYNICNLKTKKYTYMNSFEIVVIPLFVMITTSGLKL